MPLGKAQGAPSQPVGSRDLERQCSRDNPIQPVRTCKSVLFRSDLKLPTSKHIVRKRNYLTKILHTLVVMEVSSSSKVMLVVKLLRFLTVIQETSGSLKIMETLFEVM